MEKRERILVQEDGTVSPLLREDGTASPLLMETEIEFLVYSVVNYLRNHSYSLRQYTKIRFTESNKTLDELISDACTLLKKMVKDAKYLKHLRWLDYYHPEETAKREKYTEHVIYPFTQTFSVIQNFDAESFDEFTNIFVPCLWFIVLHRQDEETFAANIMMKLSGNAVYHYKPLCI